MALQQYSAIKDPGSVVDYGRNWGDALDGSPGWLDEGEIIVTSVWEIASDQEATPTLAIHEQGSGISGDQTQTSVFLKGGTAGISYKLTNEIVTFIGNVNKKERRTGIILCCVK